MFLAHRWVPCQQCDRRQLAISMHFAVDSFFCSLLHHRRVFNCSKEDLVEPYIMNRSLIYLSRTKGLTCFLHRKLFLIFSLFVLLFCWVVFFSLGCGKQCCFCSLIVDTRLWICFKIDMVCVRIHMCPYILATGTRHMQQTWWGTYHYERLDLHSLWACISSITVRNHH